MPYTWKIQANVDQLYLEQQLNALESAGWSIWEVHPVLPALHGAIFTIIARKPLDT
jgi:hypothetical protein